MIRPFVEVKSCSHQLNGIDLIRRRPAHHFSPRQRGINSIRPQTIELTYLHTLPKRRAESSRPPIIGMASTPEAAETASNPQERDVDGQIKRTLKEWEEGDLRDHSLWSSYKEEYEGYTAADFRSVPNTKIQRLRNFLRKRGVWIEKSSMKLATALFNALQEDEPTEWTAEEARRCDTSEKFISDNVRYIINISGLPDNVTGPQNPEADTTTPVTTTTSFPSQQLPQQPPPTFFPPPPTFFPPPPTFFPPPPPSGFAPFGFPPATGPASFGYLPTNTYTFPAPQPPPGTAATPPAIVTGYGKELANMAKMYTEEAKYGGEDDSLSFKLAIFHDICLRSDIPHEARTKAFPIMLKGLALDYYYSNISISGVANNFDGICYYMMTYFEGPEHKRGIMAKWNGITFKSVISRPENEGKSMEDCLQLLIKELRHLQHSLDFEYRTEKAIRDKLISACQETTACQYACYRPSESFAGLINDLRSSIVTHNKANPSETFFTDRRYYRHPDHKPTHPRFRPRSRTPYNPERARKKCFVCHQEGCWSTKHSKEEREDSRKRFRERLGQKMDKKVNQYIADYEGTESDMEDIDDTEEEMEALIVDVSPPSSPPPSKHDDTRNFLTSFGNMENAEMMTTDLANRSCSHFLGTLHYMKDNKPEESNASIAKNAYNNGISDAGGGVQYLQNFDPAAGAEGFQPGAEGFQHPLQTGGGLPFSYISTDRYSDEEFHGIMIDTGASKYSTAGYGQCLAYKRCSGADIDDSKAGTIHVQFGIGSISSIGSMNVQTPIGRIEFHVVKADTPFLLCLSDMDRLKVYLNNVDNTLVTADKTIPICRRFGHPFLLWDTHLYTYIVQSFDVNPCFLTETELRRLHRRFGHPSASRLRILLERSGHDDGLNKAALERLTRYCSFCQKHGRSPGRFKFTLTEDSEFNYSIIVDIMYIDNSPILHIVDESTRFQAARWLTNITAKHTWETLRMCWIDVYIGPPDYIHHDAGKNFVSREFRQLASSMGTTTRSVPVEAHWSIGIVERYHAILRRAYKVIMDDLHEEGITKDLGLQMAVKAINDTAGPNGLVPTLLVFGAYPRMHSLDLPAPSITKRASAIEKAMEEVRKVRAERQISDALNTRNGPIVDAVHDLPLNSDVLVYREGNAGRHGAWSGPFKLIGIQGETCRIELPSGPTEFRSTHVKPYLTEPHDDDDDDDDDDNPPAEESEQEEDMHRTIEREGSPEIISPRVTRPIRERRLPERYRDHQEMAETMACLQDDTTSATPFVESRRKEINGLLEKGVFDVIPISKVPSDIRIFKSRFVDEIKNIGTADAFEKSRLVVQAYNDQGKGLVLTQAPTIQRVSQRMILALTPCVRMPLYLRDISQAYVQSSTSLNREFYIRPPPELNLDPQSVLKVVKPLYGVPEAGAHWFNTYHNHHVKKLSMAISTYDPCLLYTPNDGNGFGIVGLQTDDSLILADDTFALQEERQLHEAKLLAKQREKLTTINSIKFNGGYINLEKDGSIYLSQERQCKCLRLVTLKASNLVSARGNIRKAVTSKDQYIAQRARGAYIATVSQPEAAFDLSYAAQVVNPKEEDAKTLNKRLQWQIDHSDRGLRFVQLDTATMKLMIFTDASFANNINFTSQIGHVIVLADATNKSNIIHWSSIKCKRVTRSVLASELYAMTHGFDAGAVLKSTIEKILNISVLPMILCTDSKSLYDCLVKLGSTQEKRLMIDLMCLRQSYERREIMEVKWIDGGSNPADAMTKARPCQALQELIDSNMVSLKTTAWVERSGDDGAGPVET